jgi:hypothetical protein
MDYLVTAYYTDGTIHKWGDDDLNESKDTFAYVMKDKEANGGLQEASLIEVETGIGIKNYYN